MPVESSRFGQPFTTSFAVVVVLTCIIVSETQAQNSSLLHAPMQRSVAQSPPPAGNVGAREVIPAPAPDGFRAPAGSAPAGTLLPSSNGPTTVYGVPGHGGVDLSTPWTGLQTVSWTYQPAPPLRQFRIQDPVEIRVDEISRMMAEGEAEKRRVSLLQATLADWITLGRGGIVPDPQVDGDPTVNAQSRANSTNEATVESRETLSFNIAARIVDIQPNGNLVLEARKTYRVNDNLWETSVSGVCRAADIGPDNVVLSRDLVDLEIRKDDQGQLRDGYQRGWFQRFFDRVKPF